MKDTIDVFIADTYAFIEIIKGNKNYRDYSKQILLTTKFNLAEIYYYLLKSKGFKVANKYIKAYQKLLIPVSISSIKNGMAIKLKYKKEKLSYTDCIVYALALELNTPFLTGDNQFKNKECVRFVK